jgi:hypothetical protein
MNERIGWLLLITAIAACACQRAAQEVGDTRQDEPTAAQEVHPEPEEAGTFAPSAFTAEELDAFERGFAKEIELVRAARARADAATTPDERGKAVQEQWEDSTAPGGAQAAGLTPERYREVRDNVTYVLETLDLQGKIDAPMEMDPSQATPAMRERMESDPFSRLPAESADALRARLDRLAALWSEYVSLGAMAG